MFLCSETTPGKSFESLELSSDSPFFLDESTWIEPPQQTLLSLSTLLH